MHSKITSALAGLALVAAPSAVVAGTAGSAGAMACAYSHSAYTTPQRGRKVWIPTSEFSDWKKGGSITRTVSDGQSTARTKGSAHSVGVDGKIGGKIGPVGAEVTVKYNYTWNKSTTTTTSVTRSWAYSFNVPTNDLYRARSYKLGWRYKFKKIDIYDGGPQCEPRTTWRYAFAPVKANAGTYYWALEKRSKKNSYRYDGL